MRQKERKIERVQTRLEDFPHDERKITDHDFFKALDLSRPGLKKVAEAYRKHDLVEARRATVEYFRTRKRPVWLYDLRGASAERVLQEIVKDREKLKNIIHSADGMLKNRFYILNHDFSPNGLEFDFGSNLGWNVPELQEHNHVSEFFKRMRFLEPLAIAYLVLKKEMYLSKYVEVLDKYLREWPLVWDNKEPTAYFVQQFPVQEAMSTAYRAFLWISLLYTDVPYHQRVPSELTFQMIRSIWFTAWQYRRFDTDHLPQNDRSPFLRSNNHHFFERGQCPFGFALMLPEFPSLRPMLQHGRQVVEEHVRHDFFEEGGYNEHSMNYTVGAVLMLNIRNPSRLAQVNRTYFFGEKAERRIQRCFDTMASLVMPNGYFPDIGDAGGFPAQMVMETGRDLFGSARCDAVSKVLKLCPGVAAKKMLPEKGVCYRDAGYLAGRDHWSPQSNYFIMCVNTRGVMGHDHQDMLSLILSVKGETMIGEPAAGPLYQFTNTKEYKGSTLRGYLYNMTSHNTVLAYGKPIQEDILFGTNWGGYPPPVKILDFQPGKNHLYVSATHDGYTSCRHLRHVLFIHQRGWLILDRILQGPATNLPQVLPHIQRWHFDSGVSVEQMDSHALLAKKGNTQLLCIWPKAGTGKVNMELRKNTTIQVGPFREEEKLPWMVDASFEKTNQAWLPCIFLVIEGNLSEGLLDTCRERVFTEVFKRAIDPIKDTAAISTLTKE